MPNDDFKEFIIQVLVHLDILVEPRHYSQAKDATHLIHQYKELQLDDTNKYLLVFPLKAKHSLQHQLT
jgi:hypothetical protein